MKKLFYLLMMAFGATLFTACSDDDKNDTPINGLDIPKFENPVTPGQTVTIKGEGFNKSSEIWFRRIATRATDNGDVKAEVTNVDANGITFLAPEVYGNQSVLLKQDGKEYKLGEMLFADQPEAPADVEILPKRIKRILDGDSDGQLEDSYEYEYDYDADGRIISCKHYGIKKYTYSENKITIRKEGGDEDGDETNFVLENGRIKSYRYVDNGVIENGTVTYDGDYLNKVNGVGKDDDGEEAFTETFTFSNGNMVMYKCEASNYANIEFTYGEQLNNLNINLFYFFGFVESCIRDAFLFDTTIGKRSHHLPSSMKVSYPKEDEEGNIFTDSYTIRFEYEMDGEYITKITSKSDDNDDYAETFVIEYE